MIVYMYVQKKNSTWWLRSFMNDNRNSDTAPKTVNRNLGKNYKTARQIVVAELSKNEFGCWMNDIQRLDYNKKLLDKMDEIEKENPSFVNLKLTYRQYEKIKSHLPPELQGL